MISFILGLTSKQPLVVNTSEEKETEEHVGLYDMSITNPPTSTHSLTTSLEELSLTLGPLEILNPVIQFPTANSIQTNPVSSSFPFVNVSWPGTKNPEISKVIKQESDTAENDEQMGPIRKNDANSNLSYCLSLIGELCSRCPPKANLEHAKEIADSKMSSEAQQYNIFGPSTEPTPSLEMCLPRPHKAERPRYTFLPLKNEKPTADSIFNAQLKTVTRHHKQTLYFVSGELTSTDTKMNQLLKKLTKTTTNPNILKAEINPKQQLKLEETNASQAPLLKRILGGQSAKKTTKKPSLALGTEPCIMIKTHPRRHKGGDPGNHYFHGKLITTVVCEPLTKTSMRTNECTTVSPNEDKHQDAHQRTIAPEAKTISAKMCKQNNCEECQINDLKDILPQSPNKNHRYLVD